MTLKMDTSVFCHSFDHE